MVKALSVLNSIDSSRLSAQALSAAECLRRAFADPPRAEDLPPLSQRVLISYRHYWQTLMLRRSPVEDAEGELLASLNTILAGTAAAATGLGDLDAASEHAKGAIENEGLFALTGVTSPYYELMIWRVESPRTYRVALPECVIDVRVVFLDEFTSLGWAGFATCGRYYSAGWATEDSLFAVQSAHETESEGFRVSYLAHEGRHFSDYKEFPKLEQSELEYRAKLTEIAVSENSTHDLRELDPRFDRDVLSTHRPRPRCPAPLRELLGDEEPGPRGSQVRRTGEGCRRVAQRAGGPTSQESPTPSSGQQRAPAECGSNNRREVPELGCARQHDTTADEGAVMALRNESPSI
jgi:hypothetical protein